MDQLFSRTERLLGPEAMRKLRLSRVAVFGIGGVGGYVVETLARSGVGALDLIDNDRVALSNVNRQIIATQSTIGMLKTEAAAARVHDINPEATVYIHNCLFLPQTAATFDFSLFDYVVDAIDTVSGKIEIILRAQAAGVPVISAMGAGNKLDPARFCVADIYETHVCPLARVMRRELKKRSVEALKVVYSDEPPLTPRNSEGKSTDDSVRRAVPGSCAFVPPVAGLILASEVVRDLIQREDVHGSRA